MNAVGQSQRLLQGLRILGELRTQFAAAHQQALLAPLEGFGHRVHGGPTPGPWRGNGLSGAGNTADCRP